MSTTPSSPATPCSSRNSRPARSASTQCARYRYCAGRSSVCNFLAIITYKYSVTQRQLNKRTCATRVRNTCDTRVHMLLPATPTYKHGTYTARANVIHLAMRIDHITSVCGLVVEGFRVFTLKDYCTYF